MKIATLPTKTVWLETWRGIFGARVIFQFDFLFKAQTQKDRNMKERERERKRVGGS